MPRSAPSPTFRVINMTEKRDILTGLSLDQAHRYLDRFRKEYQDSRWTLGPDVKKVA